MTTFETEKIVIKNYKTDFGEVFDNEADCLAKEREVYLEIYNTLSVRQKCFVDKLISELKWHENSNYCELGITDPIVADIMEYIKSQAHRKHRV